MFKLIWGESTYELEPGEYILGRSSRADIQIVHDSVSRQHARLIVEERAAYIEDLGSSNGTYINGKLVTSRTPLADGDRVHLGKAMLEISLPIEEAPTVILAAEDKPEEKPVSRFDEKTAGLEELQAPLKQEPPFEPTEVAIPTRETPAEPETAGPPSPPPPPPVTPTPPSRAPSPPMTPPSQQVRTLPPVQAELADVGPRLVGWLIDAFAVSLLVIPFVIIAPMAMNANRALGTLVFLLFFGLLFAFTIGNLIYGPAVKGKSIGMHLMKIRLVTEDFQTPIGWSRAIIRWLIQGLCSGIFFIGYLWALFDPKRQTLHDKVAKTLVIRESR